MWLGKTIDMQSATTQTINHPIKRESLKVLLMAFYVPKTFFKALNLYIFFAVLLVDIEVYFTTAIL